jgi:hypothetical protein
MLIFFTFLHDTLQRCLVRQERLYSGVIRIRVVRQASSFQTQFELRKKRCQATSPRKTVCSTEPQNHTVSLL